LRRQGAYQPEPGWVRVLVAVLAGSVAMVAALLWLNDASSQWATRDATSRAYHLVLLIVVGAGVYTAATLAGGLRLRHLEKGAT